MLQLAAIDTTEITDLATVSNVSAFDVLTRDRVSFGVEKRPIYLGNGRVIPNQFATVRTDNETALGIVGSRYNVIQNRASLDLLDAAARAGRIEYGRAGTFKAGAIVWLQAKLPGSLKIGPDEVDRFLLLATTHDGSGKFRGLITPIRVSCRNSLAMALRADAGMSIMHTASANAKIAAAQAMIESAGRFYQEFEATAGAMFSKKLGFTETRNAIAEIMPVAGDELSTRLENTRAKVLDLVENGRGQYAIRGTAWGVYNAVAEYTDHHRATRGTDDNRLESAWFGSGAALKRKAFEVLTRA